MQREQLGSRLGFILLSAGCAIGIGNVWKFPYMVGQNGGGIFVLIYLFFLLIMGIPVMTMEFSLGRASQKSPVRLYQALEPKGSKWHLHGYLALAGNYLLMMFYTTVAGWMIQYFLAIASGRFNGMDTKQVEAAFNSICANPVTMVVFACLVVVLGFFICSFSLQKGVEKVSKFMMLALLIIMVILAINSFTMDGAKEGLSFYLKPDLGKMQEVGIGNVIVGAMTQAFFTLSLGIGAMAIFGSYIGKERTLLSESVNITLLDTFVALMAGLIIFPACFSFGVNPGQGPGLVFVTLPNIFGGMAGGRVWGALFFVFMSFAALSTVIAVFENIVAFGMDLWGWSRKKAVLVNFFAILVLSLPCVLGYNVLSGFMPFGEGSAVLDLEDFLVSNTILPLGSLVYLLFCTSRYGWGWKNFVAEADEGKGIRFPKWARVYVSYILPLIVLFIFLMGYKDKFFT